MSNLCEQPFFFSSLTVIVCYGIYFKKKKEMCTFYRRKAEHHKENRPRLFLSIATEFGVGKTTVYDIKAAIEKITRFATETQDEKCLKKRCIIRKADDHTFDKAVYLWFIQERHNTNQRYSPHEKG